MEHLSRPEVAPENLIADGFRDTWDESLVVRGVIHARNSVEEEQTGEEASSSRGIVQQETQLQPGVTRVEDAMGSIE
jgi:hypothetical protein